MSDTTRFDPAALAGVRNLLAGKVAIVTGAAQGIGRATAMLFARQGAFVGLLDVDGTGVSHTAEEIVAEGGSGLAVSCDVRDEAQVASAFRQVADAGGSLDVLFNNAGIEQPVTASHEVSKELFGRVVDVNLKGTFFGCKHAIPFMLDQGGGAIVNNSSVSAFANVGGNLAYASTKGAVLSLTRVLAIEHARSGIRVNAVHPGVIDTAMNERNLELADDPETVRGRWAEATPMGRMADPLEVAWSVLFLASPMSTFTTGTGLLVDGGRVAT